MTDRTDLASKPTRPLTPVLDSPANDAEPLGETAAVDTSAATHPGPLTEFAPAAPRERQADDVPPVWGNVPPRNPNFTGRKELLDRLGERLTAGGTTVVLPADFLPAALHGMGGIGKTQMAVEYIYRHLHDYDVIWWIQASQPAQIRAGLTELAQRLRLPGSGLSNNSIMVPDTWTRIATRVRRIGEITSDMMTSNRQPHDPASLGMRIRMVFAVDIVGYSQRSDPQQRESQERLLALVDQVLRDVRVYIPPNDRESTGDCLSIYFPVDIDFTWALPTLIRATAERIAADNDRYRHQLRLRMAIGIGPVSPGPAGFGGAAIIQVSRLLDSAALRGAIKDDPDVDLAILVSDLLYSYVIGAGHRGIPAGEFRRVRAIAKDFEEDAWLWCALNPDDG